MQALAEIQVVPIGAGVSVREQVMWAHDVIVKSGLKDLSVSRTKVAWGVPLPSDPGHTVYVYM